jgi:outer membrane protein OmpA-like peptidoglycan-associated protein
VKHAMTLVTVMAGAALAAGCASTPKTIPQLEQARADVQQLAQSPLAQQAASRELASARTSLDQAESALTNGKDQSDVVHYAYLASRAAETGEARIAEAEAKQKVAQAQADRNRVLLEARTREARQATQEARVAQASAEAQAEQTRAAREQVDDLHQQLQDLQAKQTNRGMVLTLSDVLFDTGKATLKPGASLALNRIARFMKDNDGTRVIVEGYTDSRGPAEYNQELSQQRAQAVAVALESRGVDPSRVEPIGRGESFPVASNDTAAGQQQNRRVEIVFSDNSGRFADAESNRSQR